MKSLRFISTFAMLALATVVTAGSMYVTVNAAGQQEDIGFDAAATAPNAVGAQDAGSIPDVAAAIENMDVALDKTQILQGQQNHVLLDHNGGFTGRLSSLNNTSGEPVSAANVSVRLAQHGAIIGSTTTDESGRFSFTSLPEGVVAVWAESADCLMMFSCVLFGEQTVIPENAGLIAAHLELGVDSAVTSGADIATVKELIYPYIGIEDKRFVKGASEADQEFGFSSGTPSTALQNSRVRLQDNGSVLGEMSVLDERTGRLREVLDLTVHFVRNGVRVTSSEVANNGSFTATGLTPGVYSVVAVGQDGVCVFSVDIVGITYEDNTVQNVGLGEFTPVNTVASSLKLAGSFGGAPVGASNFGSILRWIGRSRRQYRTGD